jgi:hypothetical protein
VGDLALDLGFFEADSDRALDASHAFSQAAQRHLSNAKTRRRPQALDKITEEDFTEGAERSAFLVVMHYAHGLFNAKKPKEFRESLGFFFSIVDNGDLTFPLCCDVLRARPDVVRLRIQYEWWLRGTIFTGPFPFSSVGCPRLIEGEVMYHAGRLGYALTREAWVQPGISTEELLSVVAGIEADATSVKMLAALETLQNHFILSKHIGWYCTGRNPMLMNMRRREDAFGGRAVALGGSMHWARLFSSMPF